MKFLITLLLSAASLAAVIAPDSTASVSGNSNSPVSWTHTIGAGSHMSLVVYIFAQSPNDVVNGVTAGGAPMTRIYYNAATSQYRALYAYWIASPPMGSDTITITWTQQYDGIAAVSVSYSGTSSGVPSNIAGAAANNVGSGVSFTQTLTTATDRSWAIGVARNDQGDTAFSGGGTTVRAASGNNISALDNNAATSPAGSVSFSVFDDGTSNWNGIIIELQPYTAGGAGPGSSLTFIL